MLTFRMYHTLNLQYYELLQAVNNGFEMSGLCGLCGNKILFESIGQKVLGFCFETGVLEECPLTEQESLSANMQYALETEPETDMAEIFKFLFTILRRNFGLEPYADDYMLKALCRKLNKRLVRYDGHCFLETGDVCLFTVSDDKGKISLESLAEKLRKADGQMTAMDEVYANYQSGQRERKFCRFAEAENYLSKVLSAERKGSILYQETCFEMGEVYYFTGRLKEAAECYRSCNRKLLDKGEELFLRLGYCLAEMKKSSEVVAFYTRCQLNGRYMAEHKDKFSEEEIPTEEFEEYSRFCEKLGASDWKQNFGRN